MRRRKTPYLGPFANGFANALANRALDRLRYVHHRFHAADGRGPFWGQLSGVSNPTGGRNGDRKPDEDE